MSALRGLDPYALIASLGPDMLSVFKGYVGAMAGVNPGFKPSAISLELAAQPSSEVPKIFDAFASGAYKGGLSTSDIAEAYEANVQVIARAFEKPIHRKLTRFSQAVDFRKAHILTGFEDIAPTIGYQESGEIPHSFVSEIDEATGSVQRKPSRVIVPYEVQLNQTDWVNTIPAAILAGLYREEAAELFALLEANPTLHDGQPLFVDGENSTTAANPQWLDLLLPLFRGQKVKTTGQLVGSEPKYLVVPASHEITSRTALKAADLSDVIEVVARADVLNAYLLADPQTTPTIVRHGFSEEINIYVQPVPRLSRAIAVTAENSFSYIPVSRYGICRILPQ